MAASNEDVASARRILEKVGIRKSVNPQTLVAVARRIKKPLRDTLDLVAQAFAAAEGLT